MPTGCSCDLFGFAPVEGRRVEAAFDGGDASSDAGALLLGATDRAIGLVGRFAACFDDGRDAELVEHTVATMVAQRVFGIALGYEDLIDHDQLRHDPVLATLVGKLHAKRKGCAPLAGKSTLNRLEHAPLTPGRYHKIGHDGTAIEQLLVDLFLEAHRTAPREIILDLDTTDDPLHGHQEGRFFHGYYDCYCYLPLYVPAAVCVLWQPAARRQAQAFEHRLAAGTGLGPRSPTRRAKRPVRSRRSRGSSARSGPAGRG